MNTSVTTTFAGVLLAVAALGACGTTTTTEPATTTAQTTTAAAYDGAAFAARVTAAMAGPTCNPADPTYRCFLQRVGSQEPGEYDMYFSYPTQYTWEQREQFNKTARAAVYAHVGTTIPELQVVITFNNGVDTGATRREEVPYLK